MNKEPAGKVLRVTNQIEELARVEVFLEELAEDWDISSSLVLSLNLVLEEALTNTILYGFNGESSHTIDISFTKTGNELSISIVDDGLAFDPTLQSDPDLTLSIEDRPVGGLGIYMIKKVMDQVQYQRIEDKNYLNLTKKIG
jgi:anti-sigma regulatory factor (Ser/Thr protein kinase)